MELDRNYQFKEFLKLIFFISDKDFQKRVWIKGIGPERIDYDETIEFFFADVAQIIHNYEEYGINENQYQLLKEFYHLLDDFSDKNYIPFEFIDTPEWQHVVDEAKKVLEAFNYKKT
jgi:hypothetical protein